MLLKRDSNTGLSENTYFVEDLWTAGSEKPMRLFKNNFFYRTSPVAASDSFRFPSCNFIQKETGAEMFICEICKFLENIFWQNTTCEFWEVLGHLFYKAPFGNCLFHLQVAEFQPPHTVKKYCTSAFQAFYTRRKSCSKAFIYLKSLKIICEEVKL